MLEIGDLAIKLLGKTIQLHSNGGELSAESNEDDASDSERKRKQIDEQETEKGPGEHTTETIQPEVNPKPPTKEKTQSSHQTEQEPEKNEDEEQKPNDVIEEDSQPRKDAEKDQDDTKKNPQEKTIKKPDRILPCPRCNSMETKFCYFNNYNVNQPRHFCKSCQRYWTAGGTMRNVPVGAGSRKNKSSGSRHCQISVTNTLQAARINLPNGTYNQHHHHHPIGLKAHETVLAFGGGRYTPLCESMASVLNLAGEKKDSAAIGNGLHKSDHQISFRSRENGDDPSSASSTVIACAGSVEEGGKVGSSKDQIPQNLNGFANQVPSFPGFQWPYGWNPCVPFPHGFCLSTGFPMPFYPPPFWNGVAPMPWNVPCVSSTCSLAPKSPSLNPNSPTLGKHSRDGETLKPNDPERSSGSSSVLVPKTLRIDDPEEAAKSSIWTTLGIKKEMANSVANGGFFKGLQPKKLAEEKSNHQEKMESSPILNTNPAALARSISLQERA